MIIPKKGLRVLFNGDDADGDPRGVVTEVTEFGGFEVRFNDGETYEYGAPDAQDFVPEATGGR